MEIPAGPVTAGLLSGNSLNTGTPTAPISVEGLPPELLRPQVIEAVVARSSPLLAGTSSPTPAPAQSSSLLSALVAAGTTTATTTPAAPPTGTSAPIPGTIPQTLLQITAPTTTPSSPQPPTLPVPAPNAQNPAPLPNLPLLQVPQHVVPQALFRIALQWQGKTFDVLSPRALPVATPVRIQVNGRNELILRSAVASNATGASTPQATTATRGASLAPPLLDPLDLPPTPPPTPRQQALQSVPPLVRENLPRQQPLTALLPALKALIVPEQLAKMPPPLARALVNLWQSLPEPKQLQQPQPLRQILRDSGAFLEAHIAEARAVAPENPQALPRVLSTDLKAQITLLLTLLKSRAPAAPTATPADSSTPVDMVYQKPLPRSEPVAAAAARTDDGGTDQLLQQLGKVLEGSLSRIHLNQLDSVVSRHSGPEAMPTVPTWVMELPVRTQHGHDRIQVRIEEHSARDESERKKQWIVQLGFDLHELGKLSATLSVIERSVAATLWAEQEHTHRTVQREMASLRAGLEAAGVRVTDMQCRHGVAPEQSGLVLQRLVDTHS